MSSKEAAQRGSTPDVTPPCPTAGAATSSDDVPAALEQAGDLVASYLSEEMAEGAEAEDPSSQPARAGQVPLPAHGAQAVAQAPVPVAPSAAARPATAGIGTLQQSLAAGVQHTLAQGIATGAVDAPRLVSVAANGALTFDFGAPGPAAAAAVGGSTQPNGSAPGALQSGPILGGPGGNAVGGAVQPAAPAHGMRGVVEAPPGSGQFKLAVKLLTQGWLRCGGYKSAALVAVGHDHIRLWQALHPAGAPPGPEAPVPHAEELVQLAAAAGQAGLNFPLDCYTDDSMLLVKLHRSSLPDLQEHLLPHILEEWASPALADVALTAAEGPATAATRRRDNTSGFVGVSRNTDSSSFAAAVHVHGKRVHLGTFPTEVEAAIVRDIGVIWKQICGMEGSMLNLPRLGLDKDDSLLEQLADAPTVEGLKEVLDSWVPANLRDTVEVLQSAGGQRAALESLAAMLGETGALQDPRWSKAPPGDPSQPAHPGDGGRGSQPASSRGSGGEQDAEQGGHWAAPQGEQAAELPSSEQGSGHLAEHERPGAGGQGADAGQRGGEAEEGDPEGGQPGEHADGGDEEDNGEEEEEGQGGEEEEDAGEEEEEEEEEQEGSDEQAGTRSKKQPRSQRAGLAGEPNQCTHCGAVDARAQGRHPTTRQPLCAVCLSYLKRNGHDRPQEHIAAVRLAKAAGWTGRGRLADRYLKEAAAEVAAAAAAANPAAIAAAAAPAATQEPAAAAANNPAPAVVTAPAAVQEPAAAAANTAVPAAATASAATQEPAAPAANNAAPAVVTAPAATQEPADTAPAAGQQPAPAQAAAAVAPAALPNPGRLPTTAAAALGSQRTSAGVDDGDDDVDETATESDEDRWPPRRRFATTAGRNAWAMQQAAVAAAAAAPLARQRPASKGVAAAVQAVRYGDAGSEGGEGDTDEGSEDEAAPSEEEWGSKEEPPGEATSGDDSWSDGGVRQRHRRRQAALRAPRGKPGPSSEAAKAAAALGSQAAGPHVWQDAEHTCLEHVLSAEEAAAKSLILPGAVWRRLAGALHGEVLLRAQPAGGEHILRLHGALLEAPEVFGELNLAAGSCVLLRLQAPRTLPPSASGGRGRAGGRGRGRGRWAAPSSPPKLLPVVGIAVLASAGQRRPRACTECGATSTLQWRRPPQGREHTLCDDCGKRAWQEYQRTGSSQLSSQQAQQAQQGQEGQEGQGSAGERQQAGEQGQRGQSGEQGPAKPPAPGQQQQGQSGGGGGEPGGGDGRPGGPELPTCTHCGADCTTRKQYKHPESGQRLCVTCRYAFGRDGRLPELVEGGGVAKKPKRAGKPAAAGAAAMQPAQPESQQQQEGQQVQAGERVGKAQPQAEADAPPSGTAVREQAGLAANAPRTQAGHQEAAEHAVPGRRSAEQQTEPAREARQGKEQAPAQQAPADPAATQPADGQPADARLCLGCGCADARGPSWRSHPETGAKWLCHPCFLRARNEKRKKTQEQRGEVPAAREEQQPQPEEAAAGAAGEADAAAAAAVAEPAAAEFSVRRRSGRHPGQGAAAAADEEEAAGDGARHGEQRQAGRQQQTAGKAALDEEAPPGVEPPAKQRRTARREAAAEAAEEAAAAAEEEEQAPVGQQLPAERVCLACSSTTSNRQWNSHPVTKERWLCSRCYSRAFAEKKRAEAAATKAAAAATAEGEQPAVQHRKSQRQPAVDAADTKAAAHAEGVPSSPHRRSGRHQQQGQETVAEPGASQGAAAEAPPATQRRQGSQQAEAAGPASQGPANAGRQAELQQEGERVCTLCGAATSKGQWHRHPGTKARVCSKCIYSARTQFRKQQQAEAAAPVGSGEQQQASRGGQTSKGRLQKPTAAGSRAQQSAQEAQPTAAPEAATKQPTAARKRKHEEAPRTQATGADPSPDAASAPKRRQEQAGQQAPAAEALQDEPEPLAVDAAKPAARGEAHGQRGKGGGPCIWLDAEHTALQVEVSEFCSKHDCLRMPAAMAAELAGLPTGGLVDLCLATDASVKKWRVELKTGNLEAEKLYRHLAVNTGDRLLLQRLPKAPRSLAPLLSVAKLAAGEDAGTALGALRSARAAPAASPGSTPASPAAGLGKRQRQQQQEQVTADQPSSHALQQQQGEQEALPDSHARKRQKRRHERMQAPEGSAPARSEGQPQQPQQQQPQQQEPPHSPASRPQGAQQPAQQEAPAGQASQQREQPPAAGAAPAAGGAIARQESHGSQTGSAAREQQERQQEQQPSPRHTEAPPPAARPVVMPSPVPPVPPGSHQAVATRMFRQAAIQPEMSSAPRPLAARPAEAGSGAGNARASAEAEAAAVRAGAAQPPQQPGARPPRPPAASSPQVPPAPTPAAAAAVPAAPAQTTGWAHWEATGSAQHQQQPGAGASAAAPPPLPPQQVLAYQQPQAVQPYGAGPSPLGPYAGPAAAPLYAAPTPPYLLPPPYSAQYRPPPAGVAGAAGGRQPIMERLWTVFYTEQPEMEAAGMSHSLVLLLSHKYRAAADEWLGYALHSMLDAKKYADMPATIQSFLDAGVAPRDG